MSRPESDLPTIRDLRDGLAPLIEGGFGDLPVQLVIVPTSTIEAIARCAGYDGKKPALMIELDACDNRLPVPLLSATYLVGPRPGMQ
jgi:hypothetical protein